MDGQGYRLEYPIRIALQVVFDIGGVAWRQGAVDVLDGVQVIVRAAGQNLVDFVQREAENVSVAVALLLMDGVSLDHGILICVQC